MCGAVPRPHRCCRHIIALTDVALTDVALTVCPHRCCVPGTGSIDQPGSPSSTVDGSSHSRPHRSLSHLTGQSLLRNVPTEGLASSLVSNRPPQLPKSASFMQVRPSAG